MIEGPAQKPRTQPLTVLNQSAQVRQQKSLDLDEVRARLAGHAAHGAPVLWKSLEELAGVEKAPEAVWREFPQAAWEWADGHSRRNFLKLMGASLAMAGLYGCSR